MTNLEPATIHKADIDLIVENFLNNRPGVETEVLTGRDALKIIFKNAVQMYVETRISEEDGSSTANDSLYSEEPYFHFLSLLINNTNSDVLMNGAQRSLLENLIGFDTHPWSKLYGSYGDTEEPQIHQAWQEASKWLPLINSFRG